MNAAGSQHVQQPTFETAASAASADYEDQDGDVVMADDEVEQLISSLQAARNDSSSWDHITDHASISMLLFGHQVRQ